MEAGAGAGAKFEAETDRKAESAITYIIRGRDRWVNQVASMRRLFTQISI